jgi:uroporphyrinogen-III synthase
VRPLILVLRPDPGATRTAERARALELEPVVAPLFQVCPLAWQTPDPEAFDGVLLTSAHAPRQAGPALAAFAGLPCYVVGGASAEAARAAGFRQVVSADSDGQSALRLAASAGARRLLHLTGREHLPIEAPEVIVTRRIVYAAEAATGLAAAARQALARDALVLLHSPRAASLFASFVARRATTRIAAISAQTAAAAGEGWAGKAVAAAPRDEALLELAVKLCQTAPCVTGRTGRNEHGS